MNLLKALATVSSMTLLSRILGFVRDAVIARVFGAGMATDAFFVAFKIPNLLRRLFAEGAPGSERYAEPVTELPDADVSITKRDLSELTIQATKANLSDADVIAQMEEERANLAASDRRAALPIPPQLMLSRTLGQGAAAASTDLLGYAPATDTSFSGIEVRVVPENVTNALKAPIAATREPLVEEIRQRIRTGLDLAYDRLAQIPGIILPAKPKGGMYAFFAMQGESDSRRLCADILEKAHVGLAPGYLFGSASAAFVRMCVYRDAGQIETALTRMLAMRN